MGTRADFYVGRGFDAEWLGSIAWDGYPEGVPWIKSLDSRESYRDAVRAELQGREDATTPECGWPWPWDDSGLTDYAYSFFEGEVWVSNFGSEWWRVSQDEPEDLQPGDGAQFPDMSSRKNVTLDKRSGLIVVSVKKEAGSK